MAGRLEVARRIVERHVLGEGEHVRDVHEEPAGVVVETDVIPWIVRTVGDDLHEVSPGLDIDPPPAPRGIAVVGEDSFLLNDPAGLRAFWSEAGATLRPEALAGLLAAYGSGGSRGHVLGEEGATVPRAWAAGLASVPGCAPLRVEEDGRLSLRFCSYAVVPTDPEGEDRLVVTRWNVTAERGGSMEWTTEHVADLPAG